MPSLWRRLDARAPTTPMAWSMTVSAAQAGRRATADSAFSITRSMPPDARTTSPMIRRPVSRQSVGSTVLATLLAALAAGYPA